MAKENISGYQIALDEMKPSTCGTIGIAAKDGKKYFCKRFNSIVEPADNGALGPRAIEKNKKLFDAFAARKRRVNSTLRNVSGLGGNIVFPIDETVYDHHWTEFSELIENAIPEDRIPAVIAGLSPEERLLVLKIAIGALQTIHGQKMVHADLKLTNIMLVKNSSGHYVSKIIDFDGAFFEDDIPVDSITGTPDYYSPELAIYTNLEDPEQRRKICGIITTKSDIYTMGLIFHEYLAGEKPQPGPLSSSLRKLRENGKPIYPWQVSLSRDEGEVKTQLLISDSIREKEYVALIADMINTDPSRRPSAAEILLRLNSHALPISTDTWEEDGIRIDAAAAAGKVIGLCKLEQKEKDKPPVRVYEVMDEKGCRHVKTACDLIADGIAHKEAHWDEPWPDDDIALDQDRLKTMFTALSRGERPGLYRLFDHGGASRVLTAQTMCLMRFARRKSDARCAAAADSTEPKAKASRGADTELKAERGLWPEEEASLKINEAALEKYRLEFQGRSEFKGVRGYLIRMSGGDKQFWPVQKCKLMRVLVPK